MPVLILAAMTINALEDPAVELDRPARNISGLVIATLAFTLVPVQDASTKEWSLGVLQNPGQYAAVFGFALIGLLVYRWVAQRWRQDKRLPQRMLAAVLAASFLPVAAFADEGGAVSDPVGNAFKGPDKIQYGVAAQYTNITSRSRI